MKEDINAALNKYKDENEAAQDKMKQKVINDLRRGHCRRELDKIRVNREIDKLNEY